MKPAADHFPGDRPYPKPAAVWSCTKCHWQNPNICKDCGNCSQPRKEKPCPNPPAPQP